MKSATISLKKQFSFTGTGSVAFALIATALIFNPWVQDQFGADWTYTRLDLSWVFAMPVQALTPLGPLAFFFLSAMTLFCASAWVLLFSTPLTSRR